MDLSSFAFTRYGYRICEEAPSIHSHTQYEICYVHSGGYRYMLGGQQMVLQSGDLVVLSSLTKHGLHSLEPRMIATKLIFDPHLVRVLNTSFGPYDPLALFKRFRNICIRLEADKRAECERILMQIHHFIGELDFNKSVRMLLAFYDLLLFIEDQCEIAKIEKPYPSTEKERLVNEIIDFIEHHYMDELRLDLMENRFHTSKYYMARVFREMTGFTIFEYLSQRRIDQAKMLLHQGSAQVSDVSYQVGFNHPAHFSRVFKTSVGMSPVQYRNLNKS